MGWATNGETENTTQIDISNLLTVKEADKLFLNNHKDEKLLDDFNANNNRIKNLAEPVESKDAATKENIDDLEAKLKLDQSEIIMLKTKLDDILRLHEQQVVDFNTRISNLRKEIVAVDASFAARMTDLTNGTKTAYDSHSEQLVAVNTHLSKFFVPGSNKIQNVDDPVNDNDCANKRFVVNSDILLSDRLNRAINKMYIKYKITEAPRQAGVIHNSECNVQLSLRCHQDYFRIQKLGDAYVDKLVDFDNKHPIFPLYVQVDARNSELRYEFQIRNDGVYFYSLIPPGLQGKRYCFYYFQIENEIDINPSFPNAYLTDEEYYRRAALKLKDMGWEIVDYQVHPESPPLKVLRKDGKTYISQIGALDKIKNIIDKYIIEHPEFDIT